MRRALDRCASNVAKTDNKISFLKVTKSQEKEVQLFAIVAKKGNFDGVTQNAAFVYFCRKFSKNKCFPQLLLLLVQLLLFVCFVVFCRHQLQSNAAASDVFLDELFT